MIGRECTEGGGTVWAARFKRKGGKEEKREENKEGKKEGKKEEEKRRKKERRKTKPGEQKKRR